MPSPPANQYGENYDLSGPYALTVQLAIGTGGALVDVSAYIDRTSNFRIEWAAATLTSTASFTLVAKQGVISGAVLTPQDWQEVRIFDPNTANSRFFGGYTQQVDSYLIGQEKYWDITCAGYDILLDRGPKAITGQYPGGDGTFVIGTTSLTPITSGSTVFTPRTVTGLYNGQKLWAYNADGTNREYITLSSVSTTATATFGSSKTVSDTTITSGAVSIGQQTVTVGSITGITNGFDGVSGTSLIIQDPGGSNEETVTATGVSGSTFTATFTKAHPANSLVKVRWQLAGGISDTDLLNGPFYTVVNGSLVKSYGLIDDYFTYSIASTPSNPATITAGTSPTITPASMRYIVAGRPILFTNADGTNAEEVTVNTVTSTTFTIVGNFATAKSAGYKMYCGPWVRKTGVTTTPLLTSLPHMKFENMTFREAMQQIVAQNQDSDQLPTIPLTSSTAIAGAGRYTVTVSSTTGITAGKILNVQNSDGSQAERVYVESVTDSTHFVATFALSKTGTWNIYGGVAPRYALSHFTDWTLMFHYYDGYDTNRLTTVALTELDITNAATQAHYTDYKRTFDGSRRYSKITVSNPTFAATGSYADPNIEADPPTGIGLRLEAKPVVISDSSVLYNADASLRAQGLVQAFGKHAERLTTTTYAQVSPYLLSEPHLVQWGNSLEPGTPATYAISRATFSYTADGMGQYDLELGPAWEEIGGKAVPVFGSGSTRDTTPPPIPTWPSGSSWILLNSYDPYSNTTQLQVQWNAVNVGDLAFYWLQMSDVANPYLWNHAWRIDAPSTSYTITGLTPGQNVYLRVIAYDTSGNYYNPANYTYTVQTTTAASANLPNPPTALTLTFNRYIARRGTTDMGYSWTAPAGAVGGYLVRYTDGRNTWLRSSTGVGTSYAITGLTPGRSYTVDVFTVDPSGNVSATACTPLTTVASTGGIPPVPLNAGFEDVDESDSGGTAPDGWTRATVGGGTGGLDSTHVLSGSNALKLTIASSGDVVQYTSQKARAISDESASFDNDATLEFRWGYWASGTTANLLMYVAWQDKSGTQLREDIAFNHSPITTTSAWQKDTPVQLKAPSGAVTYTIRVRLEAAGITLSTNVWVDNIVVNPVILSTQIAAGAVGNTQLGTVTDPSKLALQTLTGTPFAFYDSGPVQRAKMFYNTTGWMELAGVNNGGVNVGWKIRDDTGVGFFFLNPNSGSPVATVQGTAVTLLESTNSHALTVDSAGTHISGPEYLAGSWIPPVITITTGTTLGSTHHNVRCNATGAPFSVTLPAASGTGVEYFVKKVDSSANKVTVAAAGTDKIDGAASYSLNAQYNGVYLYDAASGVWDIKAKV